MRKLFLAAAGVFIAASAQADTPPAAAPAAPATPVVTSGDYVTTAPARRGLFSRLRNRMNRSTPTTYAAPMTATTTAPAAPATTAPAPMPMGKVSSAAPTTTPATGVVQTSGSTPMATSGTVTTAAYMMPMTTTTRPMRMGFFRSLFYR